MQMEFKQIFTSPVFSALNLLCYLDHQPLVMLESLLEIILACIFNVMCDFLMNSPTAHAGEGRGSH